VVVSGAPDHACLTVTDFNVASLRIVEAGARQLHGLEMHDLGRPEGPAGEIIELPQEVRFPDDRPVRGSPPRMPSRDILPWHWHFACVLRNSGDVRPLRTTCALRFFRLSARPAPDPSRASCSQGLRTTCAALF
jgi:hypothetical protein